MEAGLAKVKARALSVHVGAAALAAAMLGSTALAQTFNAPAPNNCMAIGSMAMCPDGRMSMGGMWFVPPVPPMNGFVVQNQIGPGETSMWSSREFVNPDGSRTQRWERTVRGADGAERRETQQRVIFPDGRVCAQDGPTLRCQ